jgi:hypothetical protein
MQVIPLEPTPSQSLEVVLGGQNCTITVQQKAEGLFLTLIAAGVTIVAWIVCRNACRLVRYAYLPFIGDLTFMDTQGADDPVYTGLGDRFQLCYLEAGE